MSLCLRGYVPSGVCIRSHDSGRVIAKKKGDRRRPTLPRIPSAVPLALEGLTSGFGMEPGVSPPPGSPVTFLHISSCIWTEEGVKERSRTVTRARPRRISTGQLHASQRFHLRPISPVFSRTPYSLIGMGYLILKAASRLDAFSGYPFRT